MTIDATVRFCLGLDGGEEAGIVDGVRSAGLEVSARGGDLSRLDLEAGITVGMVGFVLPGGSSGLALAAFLGGSGIANGANAFIRFGGVNGSGVERSLGELDFFSDLGWVAMAAGIGIARGEGFFEALMVDVSLPGSGAAGGTNAVLHFGHSTSRPRFLSGIPSLPLQFGQRA